MQKVLALILVVAAPSWAHAIDLTGTYEGKQVCTGLLKGSGEKDRFTITPSMRITQVGSSVRVNVSPGASYEGTVVNDGKNPTKKGQAAIVSCSPSQDASGYAELLHVRSATLAKNGVKLTVRGISTFSTVNRVGDCRWAYKRTNAADPGVGICP